MRRPAMPPAPAEGTSGQVRLEGDANKEQQETDHRNGPDSGAQVRYIDEVSWNIGPACPEPDLCAPLGQTVRATSKLGRDGEGNENAIGFKEISEGPVATAGPFVRCTLVVALRIGIFKAVVEPISQ